MVESELSYEQIRLNRVEENKKRMEELNLNKIAQSLRVSSSPKPSHTKPRTPRFPVEFSEVRRSSRAKNPPPSYREDGIDTLERPRRLNKRHTLHQMSYQRRDLLNRVYASDEARMYAIDRAEMLQSSLEQEFPSFVKPMLQSHVTGGFWLGLPHHFCKTHLPKRDEMIALVDEEDDEFETKYLADKNGLSGGWRGFAIDHQLVDGDALVFHLTTPTTFKKPNSCEAAVKEKEEAGSRGFKVGLWGLQWKKFLSNGHNKHGTLRLIFWCATFDIIWYFMIWTRREREPNLKKNCKGSCKFKGGTKIT
ncbi:unnamed protein product [Arabis nemorensis]|uniref:TF-B3 domain-containing protein n=1 Tax=Arabis nemorensis TaxID=586526 RepID=A0A565B9A7_9BRAS|nr:unnamed protein product [Arabis nemorensis]